MKKGCIVGTLTFLIASGLFGCASRADEPTGTDSAPLIEVQCADGNCEQPPPPPPPAPSCACAITALAKKYENGGLNALASGQPADAWDSSNVELPITLGGIDDRYRMAICGQLCQNEARSSLANGACVQVGYEAGLLLQYNYRLKWASSGVEYRELWGDCHNP